MTSNFVMERLARFKEGVEISGLHNTFGALFVFLWHNLALNVAELLLGPLYCKKTIFSSRIVRVFILAEEQWLF